MGTVGQLYNAMKQLDLRRIAVESIRQTETQNESELIKAQQDQMYAGLLATGLKIKPPYKRRTIAIKRRKGQPTDRVTLKDKGDFYSGIQVTIGTKVIGFTSRDRKTSMLEEKYTKDIFGLNKKSVKKFRPSFIMSMAKNIIKTLGL